MALPGARAHDERGGGARARRRRASQGHAEPAAGPRAARRLRLRPRGLVPGARRRGLLALGAADRHQPGGAAAVAARARGRRAGAAGDRPARGRGAAGADRRHRQRADHGRARRHLGVDQPGLPRFRPVPHPLHLRPAHGDHGGRGVLLHPSGAGRNSGDRSALSHQEVGGGRRHGRRFRLSA